jgi:hypothetical protein
MGYEGLLFQVKSQPAKKLPQKSWVALVFPKQPSYI